MRREAAESWEKPARFARAVGFFIFDFIYDFGCF
jgi:hypothetical protein